MVSLRYIDEINADSAQDPLILWYHSFLNDACVKADRRYSRGIWPCRHHRSPGELALDVCIVTLIGE